MKKFSLLAVSTLLLIGTSQTASAGHTNTLLEADLNGKQEVSSTAKNKAKVGDKNGKGEAYVFGIDGDPTTLCYILTVEKIQLVPVGQGIAAHIHEGDRGEKWTSSSCFSRTRRW